MKKLLSMLIICASLMSCKNSTNDLIVGDVVRIKGTEIEAVIEYRAGMLNDIQILYADDLGKLHNTFIKSDMLEKIVK